MWLALRRASSYSDIIIVCLCLAFITNQVLWDIIGKWILDDDHGDSFFDCIKEIIQEWVPPLMVPWNLHKTGPNKDLSHDPLVPNLVCLKHMSGSDLDDPHEGGDSQLAGSALIHELNCPRLFYRLARPRLITSLFLSQYSSRQIQAFTSQKFDLSGDDFVLDTGTSDNICNR